MKRTALALTLAATVVFGSAATATAATTPVKIDRKVIVVDSKIKAGTLEKERGFVNEKERGFTDSKIKAGKAEKER